MCLIRGEAAMVADCRAAKARGPDVSEFSV